MTFYIFHLSCLRKDPRKFLWYRTQPSYIPCLCCFRMRSRKFRLPGLTGDRNLSKRKAIAHPGETLYVSLFTCSFIYARTHASGIVCVCAAFVEAHQRSSSTSLHLGERGCLLTCPLILKNRGLRHREGYRATSNYDFEMEFR